MRALFFSLCGVLAVICSTQATYTYYSVLRCECNGRSRYCLHDALGLRCVDCQGNTDGRHCEKCKQGFYQVQQQQDCTACLCHPTGSVSSQCDSRGRCSCKEGYSGEKCDRCKNGQKITQHGCTQSRQLRQDSGSSSPYCFCFGHSTQCLPQSDYYVHNITSTFTDGLEGWTAATLDGETPRNVHFRWSPKHQDIEVISSNSLPVYLYAPARFLGDQLHSYGQNLSFSLRLDRGVRQPSIRDIILEGAGFRVSTSLGDLRHSVPCGQKLHYSFRLEESFWRPQLTTLQFQSLLQNLTAIKIRATFGQDGRGYLDNVSLVSAQRGVGLVPADWVRSCRCPPGLEGAQCQNCAAGFRRTEPSRGAFSGCQPCQCPGGGCDAFTGECLPADEEGGVCPHGYSGPSCKDCSEGFYREPVRGDGFPAPCTPCACDERGSESPTCDTAGTCRCKNGFEGKKCENAQCPSCFSPVTAQLEQFALKVRDLESHFSSPDLDLTKNEVLEAGLRSAQKKLDNLQDAYNSDSDMEKLLQLRLASMGKNQLSQKLDLFKLASAVENIQNTQQQYKEQEVSVETMIQHMRWLLDQAKSNLKSAEIPLADSAPDSNPFSSLVQSALDLARLHKSTAVSITEKANEALRDSEQSESLLQAVVNREKRVSELTEELQNTYKQISSGVKVLETQASQVSSQAKDESKMAANLLQDILKTEIPSSLKGEADALLSRLDSLKAASEGELMDLEELQDTVEQDKNSTMRLLSQGKAVQEVFDKLVSRVDAAKSEAENALSTIRSNTDQLQDALNTLKGFEEQMAGARALSDAAIDRLPSINATVQSANRDNAATLALLKGVSDQYHQAVELQGPLLTAMQGLEILSDSIDSKTDLPGKAFTLNTQAQSLQSDFSSTAADVRKELDQARTLNNQAQQGAKEAEAALENTQRARGAVTNTLRDISNMLNKLNVSEPLDLSRLQRLEASLENAQKEVNLSLGPRMKLMEEREQAQRRHLRALDQDLSTILRDIQNIEDILRSVPQGCFNPAPFEEA